MKWTPATSALMGLKITHCATTSVLSSLRQCHALLSDPSSVHVHFVVGQLDLAWTVVGGDILEVMIIELSVVWNEDQARSRWLKRVQGCEGEAVTLIADVNPVR